MQRSSGNIDNNTYGSWTEVDESAGSKNRLRRPYSIYGAGCLLVMRDPETNSRDKRACWRARDKETRAKDSY